MIAKMGYKQELRRAYSTVQIFAVAFSIMGLVPSIASTISFSLPAGPAGMVWVCGLCFGLRFSTGNSGHDSGADIRHIGLVDCECSHFLRGVSIGIQFTLPPSFFRSHGNLASIVTVYCHTGRYLLCDADGRWLVLVDTLFRR